jgi:hypothetical protein
MRRTLAGGIKRPHFGHTASSDARTFSRLIFRERGMGSGYSSLARAGHVHQTLRVTPRDGIWIDRPRMDARRIMRHYEGLV